LVESRQISKGMGNVIKYARQCISKVSPELSEAEAKTIILGDLQRYLEEKMIYAGESIAQFVASSVNDGDIILTFGSSPLLRKVLIHCAKLRKYRLIVVDSRPLNEGLQTLAALSNAVPCVYTPLSGAASALKDVSKVILGASCLLSNGSMLAVAGTAMVAALAKARQIPVIVASESYKFSDKVQLDSIVFNELGHSSEIVIPCPPGYESEDHDAALFIPQFEPGYRGSSDKLFTTSENPSSTTDDHTDFITVPLQQKTLPKVVSKMPFEVFNLRYDLTPLANISVIATETGLIPPTSVPVLIREIQGEVGGR
jgi:translation initiation factor eIF-2B subunit delta